MKRFHSPCFFKIGILSIGLLILAFCRNYGEKLEFKKGEVYYKTPITDSEAKELGKYLVEKGYFDGTPKALQLIKQNGIFKVRFIVKEGSEKNKDILNSFEQISALISSAIFDDSTVDVDICDNSFNTIYEIRGSRYGKSLEFGSDILFYKEPISKEKANNLGNYLISIGTFMDAGIMVMLDKTDSIYQIHLHVEAEMDEDPSFLEAAKIIAKAISKDIFSEERVDVHLCDDFFNTRRVVRSID